MAVIDFFCAPDDRHRVILLVDLLEKAGQSVVLRTEPQDEPTRPCLVACTRRGFREPWIRDLFTRARQVAALRLDDAPLPGPAAEIIDMQTWPARSADRHVGSLVDWLQGGAVPGGLSGGTVAGAVSGRRAEARGRQRPTGAVMQRLRARLADPNLAGLLALVGVLGAVAALLGTVEPGQRMARPEAAAAPLPVGEAPAADIGLDGVDGTRASGVDDPAAAGALIAAVARDAEAGVSRPEPAAPVGATAAGEASPAGHPVAIRRIGPLHRLCDARALAAAQAWSAVLHWTAATPPFDRACGGPA